MIRVTRPARAPRVLATRGRAKRAELEAAYDAAPAEYDARTRRFTFDGTVYGHETVKRALSEAQHAKCCFCESKTGMDGDVEHFRPKAGFSQGARGRIEGPGYYWLAYEWSNLLLCCAICNQRFKRNLFPLTDPAARARTHRDDLSREDPLFIDPCEVDPEAHIGFRREIPYPVDDSPYGRATIEALGLGREILNERRRDALEKLQVLHELVLMEPSASPDLVPLIEDAREILSRAVSDAGEFASMARAAARANFYLDN
ncbi:MAG TPA: hypothetical protein VHG28_17680 [Longimicrobiaceae bacterium]|nr:hypothetical protein [Longimicrobiaceae bacterium]